MNYPLWDVPVIGGSWVIGIIAIVHIYVSHFAVGGGAWLAMVEHLAYKKNDERLYDYLKSHSRFFVLITTVFGAVTGVGIWFSISLVNPDGTASLIQIFTLGWAEEYLFFVAELATAFAYYYTWNTLDRAKHLQLARFYFIFSVFTLVIINGIITFQLTPGGWIESKNWLHGFFNQTYLPSLIIRLLIMFAIAGMYGLVTATRIKDEHLRVYMVRFCARWLMPIFFLGPIVGLYYLYNVPQASITTIFEGIQSSGLGNFSILARALYLCLILSGTVLIFAYVGPYLNPRGFTFKIALAFMVCGLLTTGTAEWMREMLRKPYVVYDYMYSNGIRKTEIPELQKKNFYNATKWHTADNTDIAHGKTIFKYQCMSCHTENGYRSMKKLIGERDKEAVVGFLNLMKETDPEKNPYSGLMPPFVGDQEDMDKLAAY
ncbi:MAG TPA: hypothetical protein PKD05_10965, partial [Candidatus Melainabacteria bacterium]|nr:hypothetical protein [Candidatus Melainabacteria bacterium]